MNNASALHIEMISVDLIHVLNPRSRSRKLFNELVNSISTVGLKRPITVSRRDLPIDGKQYDLVCGQGRLEAFIRLRQPQIPAIVKQLEPEECYLMSLIENMARRSHKPEELINGISELSERGYDASAIAEKVGFSYKYVSGLLKLINNGEGRLISAVEGGRMPISVAVEISEADDFGVQQALTDAYDRNELRGKKLITARRLVEQRRRYGKIHRVGGALPKSHEPSANNVVEVYEHEIARQQELLQKANAVEEKLIFIASALKTLLSDKNFLTLLRAEKLDTLPQFLAENVAARDGI